MRVPRTFVFVDLTGFTNYTAEHGDDAAGAILSAFRTVTRTVSSQRGVRVAKWLGDGAMIVALDHLDGVATALDLEHRTAVECAPLALRAGIATGRALLFEGDDYIGSAVNLASRLCDAAGAHEVLMPAESAGELPIGVTTIPSGELELRGFNEPIAVVRVQGSAAPADGSIDPAEVWTRTPFHA